MQNAGKLSVHTPQGFPRMLNQVINFCHFWISKHVKKYAIYVHTYMYIHMLNYIMGNWTGTYHFGKWTWVVLKGKESLLCFPFFFF